MDEMGRFGFVSANAAIFFAILTSIPLALSLGIYHTYTSHTNYELLLKEGVDAMELARSKVLYEGEGFVESCSSSSPSICSTVGRTPKVTGA